MADRSVRVRLIADVNSYVTAMRQAGQTSQDFGRELTNGTRQSGEVLSTIGRTAGVAGLGIAAGLGVAVNAAMDFDRQISELGGVASATGDELDALRQQALDAGAATSYSASEAAEAQTELAKAGVSTADIMGGALTGALGLAAAGGLELGRAAEVAASAMTTFGLEGRDVTHIADVLAAGANKSATDVDELAQGLSQAGLVAAQFGLSLEDTVGVLSMFSQNGLRGSDAGTSFKTMLQRLVPTSEEAAAEMERLGLEFFDAQGQFIGIEGAAQELQDALGGLTQEQRNTSMAVLFGSDAVRAATVLYENGASGVGGWVTAVNDAGFASDLAADKLDNLAGDVEALGGAIETAFIQGGSQATGALRFLTQGATDAVNAFNEAPAAVQGIVVGLGGLTSAGLLAVGALGTIIPKVQDFRTSLNDLGPAGERANRTLGTLGRVGAYAGGIAAITAAVIPLTEAIEDFLQEAAPDASAMGLALVELGRDGRVAGELLETFGGDLRDLAGDLNLLEEGRRIDLFQDYDEAVNRIDAIDKALAQLISSGHSDQAVAIFDELMLRALDMGAPLGSLRDHLNDYRSALDAAETQELLTADAAGVLTTELGGQALTAEEATEALKTYLDANRAAIDPLFGMMSAVRDNAAAQAELNTLQASGTATAAELEAAHQAVAESALNVEEASLNLATAVENGSVTVESAIGTLQGWVAQGLITQGTADTMAVHFQNTADRANAVAGDRTANFSTNAAHVAGQIDLIRIAAERVANYVRNNNFSLSHLGTAPGQGASGGYVGHTKGGPSDTIPYWVAPGEFIINAGAAKALGPEFLGMANQGIAAAMPVPVGVGGGIQVSIAVDARGAQVGVAAEVARVLPGAVQAAGITLQRQMAGAV